MGVEVVHEKVLVQECRGRQRSRHFHFPSQEGATIHRVETGAVEILWDSIGLTHWPVYVTVLQLSPYGNQEGDNLLTTQIWSWSVETAGKQRGVETLDAGDKPQGN